MKRWQRWALGLAAVAVLAGGVGRALLARKAEQARLAVTQKAGAALELAPSDVIVVRTEDLSRTLEVSGSLIAVNSAFVKARVAAEVKSVAVREGDAVKAGQVLAQLDPTEFDWKLRQAEQQAKAAQAQFEIAQRTLQNNRSLVTQGFISATALETAVSNEAAALATLEAARAGVELARKARADTVVTAPIGGLIAQRLVQPGERVPVDAKLLEIVDLSRLELEATIPAEDAPQLRVGGTATLQIDGLDAPVTARVARINPSAQAGSRSVVAYLELEPHPALRQGLFARGRIEVDRRRTLVLPLAALRTDRARPYVMRLEGTHVAQVEPALGVRGRVQSADAAEVLGGLADGDRVLTAGVGAVPDGATVRLAETVMSTPNAGPARPAPGGRTDGPGAPDRPASAPTPASAPR